MSGSNPKNTRLGNNLKTRPSLRNKSIASAVIGGILLAAILGKMSTSNTKSLQAFSNVAISGTGNAGTDAAISGSKDGGFAWGDINNDGYLDLAVNTNSGSNGTRILIANATDPANPYFEDLTTTYCNHCGSNKKERSAILADINNDGYIDLIRNTSYGSNGSIDIYLNRGPTDSYVLGVGSNNDPDKTFSSSDFHDNNANTEGVFLADFDNDGWLDIVVENHNYGIDILQNPKDGSAAFVSLDPTTIGLPASATDGDYGTCVDFDDDGDVDILARKRNENDFFVNDGDGTFTDGQDVDDANNGQKGGVVFADFDNDGDYDLYWTDNGTNQIWLNDGTNVLMATQSGGSDGEPWLSAGVSAPSSGIDGAAVGDVNNDGKVDLFLTANSGTSYLFLNNSSDGGSLSFSQNNLSINISGNGEGAAFADYDKDGDLDLYVNIRNGSNQLWRNNLNDGGDNNYLFVEPRIDLGSGSWRSAVGANVVLQDCNGNIVSGIREVPTTSGHGTDAPDEVHFGLPGGADAAYNVIVRFVSKSGTRTVVSKQITPSDLTDQTLIIYDTDANTYGLCSDADQDDIPNWEDLDDDDDGIPDSEEMYCQTGTSSHADGSNLASGSSIVFEGARVNPVITYSSDDANDVLQTYNWERAEFGQTTSGSLGDGVIFQIQDGVNTSVDADISIDLGVTVYNLSFDIGDLDDTGGGEIAIITAFNGNSQVPITSSNFSNAGASVDVVSPNRLESNANGDGANSGTHGSVRVTISEAVDRVVINAVGSSSDWYVHLSNVSYCLGVDSDNDGIYNHLDLDSDNDGIPDLVEAGGTDVNGDGNVDVVEDGGNIYLDEDGDGVKDAGETTLWDTDNDGWIDTYDNSGSSYTSGTTMSLPDKDGDGIPDYLDLDSDNDGIPDVIEAGGVDNDGDGRADSFADSDQDGFNDHYDTSDNDPETYNDATFASSANNPMINTQQDSNGDGLAGEGYSGGDTDGDGILNHQDLDSDNDGLPDIIETGGVDTDGDGRVDDANPDGTLSADTDGDGFSDTYDPDLNNDGDTNDGGDTGQPMIITSTDSNSDGRPESYPAFDNDENGSTADAKTDADSDGIPNYLDLDSDNDGIQDIVETGIPDTNGDGKVAGLYNDGTFRPGKDADNDGFFDPYDPDDNTSPTDENESGQPRIKSLPNGSGASEGHPALADIEGKNSLVGGTNTDFDQDGIPNYLDLDADNDGISDVVEIFGISEDSDHNAEVDNISSNDANENGWHNDFEGIVASSSDISTTEFSNNNIPDYETGENKPDFDGDGYANYLDIDADNDGIVDLLEAQPSSLNLSDIWDGLNLPGITDQDYDGLFDPIDPDQGGTYIIPLNKDLVDNPDFLDLDSDNDGFLDSQEGHDGNMDGAPDNSPSGNDADYDGLDDAFDTDTSSPSVLASNQSLQDEDANVNSGGDRDWRDIGSSTFPVEWISFDAILMGNDAKLSWATASELNASHYQVDRSLDGVLFESLGRVEATGTTQERSDYTFLDKNIGTLENTRIFYRLKQIDLNGTFEYSKVEQLNIDGLGIDFKMDIYPNPAKDLVNLRLTYPKKAQVRVMNLTGQIIYEKELGAAAAENEIQIQLTSWTKGKYFVQLFSEEGQTQKTFIVN